MPGDQSHRRHRRRSRTARRGPIRRSPMRSWTRLGQRLQLLLELGPPVVGDQERAVEHLVDALARPGARLGDRPAVAPARGRHSASIVALALDRVATSSPSRTRCGVAPSSGAGRECARAARRSRGFSATTSARIPASWYVARRLNWARPSKLDEQRVEVVDAGSQEVSDHALVVGTTEPNCTGTTGPVAASVSSTLLWATRSARRPGGRSRAMSATTAATCWSRRAGPRSRRGRRVLRGTRSCTVGRRRTRRSRSPPPDPSLRAADVAAESRVLGPPAARRAPSWPDARRRRHRLLPPLIAFLTPLTAPLVFLDAPPSVHSPIISGEVLAALLVEVEPVGRLREAEVGVDAGDHDASVDRQQLDADQRDPDVGVDDDALVQDDLDDVGETAGGGAVEITSAALLLGLKRSCACPFSVVSLLGGARRRRRARAPPRSSSSGSSSLDVLLVLGPSSSSDSSPRPRPRSSYSSSASSSCSSSPTRRRTRPRPLGLLALLLLHDLVVVSDDLTVPDLPAPALDVVGVEDGAGHHVAAEVLHLQARPAVLRPPDVAGPLEEPLRVVLEVDQDPRQRRADLVERHRHRRRGPSGPWSATRSARRGPAR